MLREYKTEEEIVSLVRSFENATISRDDWGHAEHMIVGFYYLCNHDIETATEKMRSGIFNLLTTGFKVDLGKEMPYHETLTVFWMRTLNDFKAMSIGGDGLAEKVRSLIKTYDKDYPLRSYSRDLLFSDAARAAFVAPDLTGELHVG